MKIIAPIRRKRQRAGVEGTPPEGAVAESTPAESTPAESTPAESAPAESTPLGAPPSRGLVRKNAVRRWLKKEFEFPLQIREAFFTAMETKFADDLRRSVARARELKRSTLMAPDA
jgi:hypothetical protein